MQLQQPATATPAREQTFEFQTVLAHVETCPQCESSVVDGQGLLWCHDCEWTGIVR